MILRIRFTALILCITILISGCSSQAASTREFSTTPSPDVTIPTQQPTIADTETFTAETGSGISEEELASFPLSASTGTPVPTPAADEVRMPPEQWKDWPVIPAVPQSIKSIYQKGLGEGRNPRAFSRIGDCQNVSSKFLGVFDHPGEYDLGKEYQYLNETIENFKGSFAHESAAVHGGFNVASVLSTTMADKKVCQKNETPLDCEFRLNNPSIVIISMEQWWSKRPADVYEGYLSQIVEYAIAKGAVPILATKADNMEGDHRINAAIARVATKYDLPLWNFWLAVQPLPKHGLWNDGFHLTVGNNDFDDPLAMRYAWPVRNITALQVLDTVWRGVR